MADLIALSPCADLLPLTAGDTTLSEAAPGHITSLMPYRGQQAALSDALHAAHGIDFPAQGRSVGDGATRCVWTGQGQAMLIGCAPDATLADHAALSDQSDAWAVVLLTGAGGVDVLARLVPLDLRASVFPIGHTARSLLQHMTVSITRVDGDAFQIMAMRSMAGTLVQDLHTAMSLLGARAQT